jgi:hypothetical protein
LWGKISQNFDVKNMISSYKKDFPWKKNGPNLPHFTEFLFQIARFFYDK